MFLYSYSLWCCGNHTYHELGQSFEKTVELSLYFYFHSLKQAKEIECFYSKLLLFLERDKHRVARNSSKNRRNNR